MPYLFDAYCHETVNDAAAAETASPVTGFMLTLNNVIVIRQPYTAVNASSATLNFQTKNGVTLTNYSITKTYQSCLYPGPYGVGSNSGLNLTDAALTSWLVVGVWVIAWGIKVLYKRVLV